MRGPTKYHDGEPNLTSLFEIHTMSFGLINLRSGGESSKMSVKELFFLYCKLHNWKTNTLKSHVGYFVMNNLIKIIKNPKASGIISIGGLSLA
jgi:hypothetical protein